jgi:hypothetical protein
VAAGPAADVEDAIAGPNRQTGEINGNHGWSFDRRPRFFPPRAAR